MQIISISKGTQGAGEDLAKSLAGKMGYSCYSRENLIEAATKEGIQVGKLEMAMVQRRGFTQRLALERDHYLAFSRAYLCERALQESLIYHGRTGHLLLPGVNNTLRVRAVRDLEHRVVYVMDRMGLEREKALRYIREVDEDREKWVRSMYGIAVEEAINFDVTVNLEQLGTDNAAAALVATAQLPEFQLTPASIRTLEDLHLGARARLALARDEHTYRASVKVRADRGIVTVSYLPQDAEIAPYIEDVLAKIQGVADLRITMATATLLWIQEVFQPESEAYEKVVEIATKWNAAVELVRLAPEEARPAHLDAGTAVSESVVAASGDREAEGGIEDDGEEQEESQGDGGLSATLDELASAGRAGGGKAVYGCQQCLVDALDRNFPYTLVVVGDAFLEKAHAARIRAIRDLRSFISDRIRAPVVTADELGEHFLFGTRDILTTAVFAAITALLFFLVLTNQEAVLAFMSNTGWYSEAVQDTFLGRFPWMPKVVVSLVLVLFIPLVAFSYGKVAGAFMKLIKME